MARRSTPRLPVERRGYGVDVEAGEVHTRYATHAGTLTRTPSPAGVDALLGSRRRRLCRECFPPPARKPGT